MRKRAVRQVREGQSPEIVAKALGINRTTIYDWLSLYRRGGWSALEAGRRGGRPLHESRTLATLRDTLLPKLLGGDMQLGEDPKDLPQ